MSHMQPTPLPTPVLGSLLQTVADDATQAGPFASYIRRWLRQFELQHSSRAGDAEAHAQFPSGQKAEKVFSESGCLPRVCNS